ncbi:MAG: peptide deformylase [Candidatus Sumerlaeaceae bacterium]
MKLKIIKYGHPLLREKAHDVKGVGTRERELIAAMAETMYTAHGIGLAATQVGVMERLFVVDVDQDRDDDAEDAEGSRLLRVFINPEIVAESEEDEPFKEGCLSIPGIDGEVYRPTRVKVVARDENFQPFEIEADTLLARVIQHEHDHLNGVLFIDRLPLLKRPLVAGSLNKLKKEVLQELPLLSGEYPIWVTEE